MDDTCAVCAESLEWVAYGACGHKDVCSTCVARLRFICDDHRCCICKTESNSVFMTKALGDYTKTISDFSLLPSEVKEGRVGQYWYHEDAQAFFDDLDHYKMIKAMCKLSCSVCDKMEDPPCDGSRRRAKFRSIEQLKGHLFHKHKLLMCSLCLEGRKVFISEQKLFTRSQLTRHISTGDSEADGPDSGNDGFTGHPMCEFCRTPFYGDNELYTHMSTEHYTCHICQRQHPGQYDYYKNYDDLEMHFRRDHFLCEDEACLGKKFIVFQSEAEFKRHTTLEHGGRMSRSKRNAALQIPTSFRYRRSMDRENRRERDRMIQLESSENELSLAIQASLETESAGPSNNSSDGVLQETAGFDLQLPPLESSSMAVSEKSSKYLQAVSQGFSSGGLGESFPPLTVASGNQPNSQPDIPPVRSMAARLRTKNKGRKSTSSSSPVWPAANRTPADVTNNRDMWPSINATSGQSKWKGVSAVVPAFSGHSSSSQIRPTVSYSSVSASSSSSGASGIRKGISHSSSAPNLSEHKSVDTTIGDFPPVSVANTRNQPAPHQISKSEDVHSANRSLVENMRAALGFDEKKFIAFRDISGDYRRGLIDSKSYIAYVNQFGLSHLVLELARLLPDSEKQKELIDAYNSGLDCTEPRENGVIKESNCTAVTSKSKGKAVDSEVQSSYRGSEEEVVEVLPKDGYRISKGKSKTTDDLQIDASSRPGGVPNQNLIIGDGKSKLKRKTSKFHRVRLGDGSVETRLDLNKADLDRDVEPNSMEDPVGGSTTRGVWKNGGGQKLFTRGSRGQ